MINFKFLIKGAVSRSRHFALEERFIAGNVQKLKLRMPYCLAARPLF